MTADRPEGPDAAALDRAFAALGDPTRRAILERLSQGEAGFADVARPFEMSPPAVVKHLKALERAGLIEKDDEGQRPIYRLAPQALAAPRGWLDRFARFWDGALDRLEDYIAEMDAAGEDDDDPAAPEDGPDDGPGGGPGGGEDPSGKPPARSSKRQGDA
ncbi:MAG: metalloregulator ArsR/SmtB family transcription factor [Pseudomonadota bacterium]